MSLPLSFSFATQGATLFQWVTPKELNMGQRHLVDKSNYTNKTAGLKRVLSCCQKGMLSYFYHFFVMIMFRMTLVTHEKFMDFPSKFIISPLDNIRNNHCVSFILSFTFM